MVGEERKPVHKRATQESCGDENLPYLDYIEVNILVVTLYHSSAVVVD